MELEKYREFWDKFTEKHIPPITMSMEEAYEKAEEFFESKTNPHFMDIWGMMKAFAVSDAQDKYMQSHHPMKI